MKRFSLLLLLVLGALTRAQASHNVAGELMVRCLGGLQYEVTIVTYASFAAVNAPDRCDLVVDWGDGHRTTAHRTNGVQISLCNLPALSGETLVGYPSMKKNIYKTTHLYPGVGSYVIKMIDPNRVAGIDNIVSSGDSPFVLATQLLVLPSGICNSAPVLTTLPLDKACVGHCFYHNVGAYDPDGDSLSYSIGPVLDTLGNPLPFSLFAMPDAPCSSSIPHGAGGAMSIDPVSGDLSWCVPACQGKFNVGVFVHEWRRVNGTMLEVSVVYREMQIDVATCSNDNPDLPDLPDLCVDAGTTVNFNFTTSDPNNGDQVELTMYGSVVAAVPPATLTPSGNFFTAPLNATFNWNTNCDHVRRQPHTVTIKARDNDPQVSLTSIETFNITVVSPGPATLSADPAGTSMQLNWSVNPCDPAGNRCTGYKIYRHVGPVSWNPQQCETGVPAYTGFVYIASVTGLNTTSFLDNNNGIGLIPGNNYCYRVHAVFQDGAESYSSPEACNELKRDVPVISHADVISTGTNDLIGVSWYNPIGDTANFDTTVFTGPYTLRILRWAGFSPNGPADVAATFTTPNFYLLPDTFTDAALTTVSTPFCYRIAFFSGTDSIGSSQAASSVFVSAASSDNTVTLSWNENVPWANFKYEIYRKNPPPATQFQLIGTTTQRTYADVGLVNGAQYCYYVRSLGSYFNPSLPDTLRNRSQEICATPIDQTPPCAPQLHLASSCQEYFNLLDWINPMHLNCGTDDVVSYHVWFKPTENGAWQLLATIGNSNDTTLAQLDLASVAGCYAVTALDTFGNESAFSNVMCADNCPNYELPNVFTPNGDGSNDFFIPFPYNYIESVDFKIFDRWGVLIFETKDPALKWDGRNMTNNKLCTDGVYYYVCTVNEIRLAGIVPRQLTGFFHLFGKDKEGPK